MIGNSHYHFLSTLDSMFEAGSAGLVVLQEGLAMGLRVETHASMVLSIGLVAANRSASSACPMRPHHQL